MRIGVVFPQTEIGADAGAVRAYAEHAEGLGFAYLLAYDHVVGADPTVHADWNGPYDVHNTFHEPLVTFGYLAAITTTLELVTGVLILPQRQTVLVAKQAAEVDILTGGKFRLGVGVGWNEVEYEALNETFRNRGRREEEQIEVMRLLWSQESVTFKGRWHSIPGAGLKPLPIQRPIPVWVGGSTDPAFQRIGRIADGWMPQFRPDAEGVRKVEAVNQYTRDAGRDPAKLGMEARLTLANTPRSEWRSDIERWQQLGATHLSINTMNFGLKSPQEHIELIKSVYDELGLADFNR
jgi:probable F420-dependent oxidoreductase